MAAWEDESGVIPSDIQASPNLADVVCDPGPTKDCAEYVPEKIFPRLREPMISKGYVLLTSS